MHISKCCAGKAYASQNSASSNISPHLQLLSMALGAAMTKHTTVVSTDWGIDCLTQFA